MALKYYLKTNGKITSHHNPSKELEAVLKEEGCVPCDKNGKVAKAKKK